VHHSVAGLFAIRKRPCKPVAGTAPGSRGIRYTTAWFAGVIGIVMVGSPLFA